MTAFLWTMVAVFALGIFGKSVILYQQETRRSLGGTAIDLMIEVALLAWASSLIPAGDG